MNTSAAPEAAQRDDLPRTAGQRSGVIRRALRLRRTQIGLALTSPMLLVAFFGSLIAPRSPIAFAGLPATTGHGLLFGTDAEGRDVLSRTLAGGRVLVGVSLLVTFISIGVGLLLALVMGTSRGFASAALARVLDAVIVFPPMVLVLLLITRLGSQWWLLALVVGLLMAPASARVMTAAVRGVAESDYVKAAEALGLSRRRIQLTEILPNISSVLLVQLSFGFIISIAVVSSLTFLGLGVEPPTPDWGLMIQENKGLLTVQPWGVLLPVTAIVILTLGTSLVAEGVSRAAAHVGTGGVQR